MSDSAFAVIEEIRRPTLHEEVVDRIREMISQGELPVGTRVPEKELCAKFGISRTPLREALKVCANDGVITLLPNRGAWITQLTPEDVDELFPIMGSLEALSGAGWYTFPPAIRVASRTHLRAFFLYL